MREQPPEDKDLLKRVIALLNIAQPYHDAWIKKANHFYSLYRSYRDYRAAYASASPRGKDEVRRDAQQEFGADLFIPFSYAAVETIVPQMLSHRPKMLALPRTPDSDKNIENVRFVIDAQQEQIDYALKLQGIAKTGLIYGLGVQKVFWRSEFKKLRRLQESQAPATERKSDFVQVEELRKVFDDPDAVAVDPFDFLYDPFCGDELQDAEFVIHRTWRTNSYITKMVKLGKWRNLDDIIGGQGQQSLEGLADSKKWDELWQERMKAHGYGTVENKSKNLHEVLEFHLDGEQIATVLDRKIIVQSGANPHWHGEYPFQVFRPTHLPNQLPGMGAIEPIEDLQLEMNTLRSQRRTNAAFVLQKAFAFWDGMVDPEDLKFGPGLGIPVQGDPRELLFPINVGDIPYSGYQEEQNLQADIERTSGLSDAVMGGEAQPNTTATGIQLVQAAATRRIQNQTGRLEQEIIKPGGQQFLALDQQKILRPRDVRVPAQPTPGDPDRRWNWKKLGPLELAGEFEIEVSGGSTQPENVPQMRADAKDMWTAFAENPNIDQKKLISEVLEKFGIKQTEAWLVPPKPQFPPETLDLLVEKFGVHPDAIRGALAEAMQQGQNGGMPVPGTTETIGAPQT